MDVLSLPLEEVIKMEKGISYKPKNFEKNYKENTFKIFVGNLSYKTTWQELKDYMSQVGPVVFADIYQQPNGRSKGCGIVEYQNKKDALMALDELNETEFSGRIIYLKENDPDKDHKPEKFFKKPERKENFRPKSRNNFEESGDFENNNNNYRKKKWVDERSRSRSRNEYPKYEGRNENNYYGQKNNNWEQGSKLYVTNLPFSMSWRDLKDLFHSYGDVIRADIKTDRQGRSAGAGFVIFKSKENAQNAIDNLNKTMVRGREIGVRAWQN